MFKEIIVETTKEGCDYVSDAFFNLGASGVKIVDPDDIQEVLNSGTYWDYVEDSLLENNNAAVLVSAFVSDEKCQETIELLKEELSFYQCVNFGSLDITIKHYNDDNWDSEWRKYFKPIEIDKVVVVPKWIGYDQNDKIIIKINPSMAFGTGEHESTKLMLMLMCQIDLKDKFILDIGTGSGILGIAGIKLGAKRAYMCDIDSFAVKSAEESIELNDVSKYVELEQSDLIKKDDLVGDIALCNLTADILLLLNKDLKRHIVKNGLVLCSGIILSRKAEVIKAYEENGFSLVKDVTMGEWSALIFKND